MRRPLGLWRSPGLRRSRGFGYSETIDDGEPMFCDDLMGGFDQASGEFGQRQGGLDHLRRLCFRPHLGRARPNLRHAGPNLSPLLDSPRPRIPTAHGIAEPMGWVQHWIAAPHRAAAAHGFAAAHGVAAVHGIAAANGPAVAHGPHPQPMESPQLMGWTFGVCSTRLSVPSSYSRHIRWPTRSWFLG